MDKIKKHVSDDPELCELVRILSLAWPPNEFPMIFSSEKYDEAKRVILLWKQRQRKSNPSVNIRILTNYPSIRVIKQPKRQVQ